MLLFVIVFLIHSLHFSAAQECTSPSFDFANHVNSDELDLTTPPDTVIASFPVEHVRSVTVVVSEAHPLYINVRIADRLLEFVTTEHFPQYEEREVQVILLLQMTYGCATGEKRGLYRQKLKLANNHAPKFLEESYAAQVPLPLPKNFDISPFLADGRGIMARDIDLVNNAVVFGVSENDYVYVESRQVDGDTKQFKAIVRLKDQVLKMPDQLDLIMTATDKGDPPKASQVSVTIEPDLTIIYNDPPVFKNTFMNLTLDKDIVIHLELIPGTETEDVRYSIEGPDSEYFTLSVWNNNTGVDLRPTNLDVLPKSKPYLNVITFAQRGELTKTSSVVLLTIPMENNPELPNTTNIEKVLAVLHLEEMTEHKSIFPLGLQHCVYELESQTPGNFFYLDQSNGVLASTSFDREDEDLFSDLEYPQFWVVLKLVCANQASATSFDAPNRLGPIREINFSTKLTHLNIIVDDINDNSPVFTYPRDNAWFAFPSVHVASKVLPEQLLKVEATDRDYGINATIRYGLSVNDHFDIDPKTGVIFPRKGGLLADRTIELHVFATDRDGAEDGNTSWLKIRVVGASEGQLAVMTVDNIDPSSLKRLLDELGETKGLEIGTIRSVHSVARESNASLRHLPDTQFTTTAIVYAFDESYLFSHREIVSLVESSGSTLVATIARVEDVFPSQTPKAEADTTIIYPYIILAAFFGALSIALAAAAYYFRAQRNKSSIPYPNVGSQRSSATSDAVIVENFHNTSSTTPPYQQQNSGDVNNSKAEIAQEAPRIYRSLTDLLSIAEGPEDTADLVEAFPPQQLPLKKSLTFNENVEKIEIFEKY